jgi:hypothetical protein
MRNIHLHKNQRMNRKTLLCVGLLLFTLSSFSQLREIPKEVEQAFTAQYPNAAAVEYRDNLVNVKIAFSLKGEKMIASYNNSGKWKETEKVWSFEQLNADVKDGIQKSKYADWKVTETKIVYRPDGVELFRVKVEKNDIQKKHLFFNVSGRLIEDFITL